MFLEPHGRPVERTQPCHRHPGGPEDLGSDGTV